MTPGPDPAAHYDLLIIGAGMSGLAAGIRAAHFGKRVCIVEKHSIPGGLNSFYRLAGRNFDVGLHAMTNYAVRGEKSLPLSKALRQLRIPFEDLELSPQIESDIVFPGRRLRFGNGIDLLTEEVARQFPAQSDRFRAMLAAIPLYDKLGHGKLGGSAREFLREHLSDPLLIEMLLCPIMYYGSATPHDMDFEQFAIIFRSIYCEGFARPREGVRRVIATLIKKLKANGAELRMNTAVTRMSIERGRVTAVELNGKETVSADAVISSMGIRETLRLSGSAAAEARDDDARMTFVESIAILDVPPSTLGHATTISFFNRTERFNYAPPTEGLCDYDSGVICCPGNFRYEIPLAEESVRLTCIAHYGHWREVPAERYAATKAECYRTMAETAAQVMPDFRGHETFVDTFTPLTIERFTSHIGGAVYGSPSKRFDGRTEYENLFICGTDTGLLGIVGAILSGIGMVNAHVLKAAG